jgi:tetratricopeptide (TPR) repeat protein
VRHSFSDAAYALNELGVVQQLTGDYAAAAASHQQALALCRDRGNQIGQAETLNCLGELSSRIADARQARDYHAQALAIARDLGTPWKKHASWKEPAAAISATATSPEPPPHYVMRSRSTSASEAPPPGASRKPSSSSGKTTWPRPRSGKPPDRTHTQSCR